MKLKTTLLGKTYGFGSVKEVLAKANEPKSGDELAGVAAASVQERVAAKVVLANMAVGDLRNNPVVPYEDDEVTRVIQDDVDEEVYREIANWTIAELREYILSEDVGTQEIRTLGRGLTSEVIAGATKLMSNLDLILGAKKAVVTAHCNTTVGAEGTFATRLQPNHPTDDPDGVKAALMEGLAYGVGDAVIGLNPVDDSLASVARLLHMFADFTEQWKIPTQNCVLAHVTTQMEAIKQGAPSDLIFQSIAGSQKGNEAFGITGAMLAEAQALVLEMGTSEGPNVMYFETGQGSELSSDAHCGADQLTMEARCYGFAKRFSPFLVNTVVGFIGPEYLYDSKQVTRAGLEDHFMGKLTGISMGCDACYTNHMKADQNDIENLSVLLVAAGCNYVMGIPHGDDIMLMYQCTGYHEAESLRQLFGKTAIPEFEQWMKDMGLIDGQRKLTERFGDASIFLERSGK
ncbi:MAG: ethanolamine ammonia-lyase subunit EutB [Propionibacteriaceae bacterium]|nr:ethanolamine ammonia-lyase subunit EutB [Propionibacteriaceae bacterium]